MEKRIQEMPVINNKSGNKFFNYLPELIALFVLLLSGIVYVYGIEHFLDIFGNDESMYLYGGNSFPLNFPNSEYSPLYTLWYFSLNLLQPDTIRLYYLNYILMTVLPSLFIYIFLRINKADMIISFFFSLTFLLSYSNFPTWPKVSHFALLSLLTGLIISSLLTDKKHKVLAFTVCLLLTSFIRPEFFLSFILVSIILSAIYSLEWFNNYTLRSVTPLIIAALVCLAFLYVFGLPAGSGDRSFQAFGQHYARNWVKWNNDPRDPYYNYIIILKEDFGNVNSITGAILKNPSAISRHVIENISNLLGEIKYMFLNYYPIGYPGKLSLLAAIMVLIISFIPSLRIRDKLNYKIILNRISENFRYLRFFFLIVLIAITPLIMSSIFIFPRRHYLLFPGVILLLMLITIVFRNALVSKKKNKYITLIYVCILPLILVRPLNSLLNEPKPENLSAIKYLRSLKITEPVNILETWGIYSIYESKNYNRIPDYNKDKLFNEYMKEWSINMIVVSDRLLIDTRFSTDPEWLYFINNPEEFGFVTIIIPDTKGIKLLVKKDILNKSVSN